MISHSLVIGYHGCDIRVARKIISLKAQFKPSQNAWDWLGHGIYFWEDSYTRAERWAREQSRQRGSQIKRAAAGWAYFIHSTTLPVREPSTGQEDEQNW